MSTGRELRARADLALLVEALFDHGICAALVEAHEGENERDERIAALIQFILHQPKAVH
jgi:hypothetical protein